VNLPRKHKLITRLVIPIWLAVVSVLTLRLVSYSSTPGIAGHPPSKWPIASHIVRISHDPTLIMMLHPRCPSARASLTELSELLARVHTPAHAIILFVKPASTADDWVRTDIWNTAISLPHVTVVVDRNGTESQTFDSHTSGQVILYGTNDELLFTGGITIARGHTGDNEGRQALIKQLTGQPTESVQTAVFGCPLLSDRDLGNRTKEERRGSHK